MKKCPNCKRSLPDGAMFCPKCGTKLNATDDTEQNPIRKTTDIVEEPPQSFVVPTNTEKPVKKRPGIYKLLGVCIGLPICVLLFIGLFSILKSMYGNTPESTNNDSVQNGTGETVVSETVMSETVNADNVITAIEYTGLGQVITPTNNDKITVTDYTGLLLLSVEAHIIANGFNGKINCESIDGKKINDNYQDWIVVSQDIDPGEIVKNDGKLKLICERKKNLCYLSFDLEYEKKAEYENLILRIGENDIEITNDLDHVDKRIMLDAGKYSIEVLDGSETLDSERITIESDAMVTGKIDVSKKKVALKSVEESILSDDVLLEIPNVCNETLSEALSELTYDGFNNVSYSEDSYIEDISEWIVIEQSEAPGNQVRRGENILLNCINSKDFLYEHYICSSVKDISNTADALGNQIAFVEADTLKSIDSIDKYEDWVVSYAEMFGRNVTLYLIKQKKLEVPEVTDMTLPEAVNSLVSRGFINVIIMSDGGSDLTNDAVVRSQSIVGGKKAMNNDLIELKID